MNDYLVRWRDILSVAFAGIRLRRNWPTTEGAVGLWVAAFRGGHRQVSVSVWRSRNDLCRFVNTPAHRRVMEKFRGRGVLYTTAWSSDTGDPALIWQQAEDRLMGRIEGVGHH